MVRDAEPQMHTSTCGALSRRGRRKRACCARRWALNLPRAAQVTVLQIAALKKVARGTRILLLDRNGGAAKAIARELSRRGFRRTYVVQGGFSNWTSSKLQTKLSGSVRAKADVFLKKQTAKKAKDRNAHALHMELSHCARTHLSAGMQVTPPRPLHICHDMFWHAKK